MMFWFLINTVVWGTALMLDAVISYLSKDHTYVLLHVSGDNKPAISLYKKLGFVVVDSAEIYEM